MGPYILAYVLKVPNKLLLQSDHGKPSNDKDNRHVGDLGNIESIEKIGYYGTKKVVTNINFVDSQITLEDEENGITGKAFVIHAGEDDLGMGEGEKMAGSLKTGNAGGRLACGIVQPLNY